MKAARARLDNLTPADVYYRRKPLTKAGNPPQTCT